MRRAPVRSASRALLIIAMSGLLPACASSTVDLSGVQNFAKQVDSASATIDQIPDSYAQACDTMIEYQRQTSLGMLGNPPPTPNPLTSPPVSSLGPVPVASSPSPAPALSGPSAGTVVPVPIPVATPTAGPSCRSVHDVANIWKKSDTTVELYVKGLGKVAGVTTAPSQTQYTSFADAVASDGILPKTFAEAAASFIAAIGNTIIAQEQGRALSDLIDASQKNDILNVALSAGQNAAIDAHIQYVATLVSVNSRYNNVISPEQLLLNALKVREKATPNAQMLLATEGICPRPPAKEKNGKRCLTQAQVESWYALETELNVLRLRILQQRAAWMQIDQSLQASDNKLQPYVNTMRDIGQINASLVRHKTGFEGFVEDARPWFDDLVQQGASLVSTNSAGPASASTSTHHR